MSVHSCADAVWTKPWPLQGLAPSAMVSAFAELCPLQLLPPTHSKMAHQPLDESCANTGQVRNIAPTAAARRHPLMSFYPWFYSSFELNDCVVPTLRVDCSRPVRFWISSKVSRTCQGKFPWWFERLRYFRNSWLLPLISYRDIHRSFRLFWQPTYGIQFRPAWTPATARLCRWVNLRTTRSSFLMTPPCARLSRARRKRATVLFVARKSSGAGAELSYAFVSELSKIGSVSARARSGVAGSSWRISNFR